MGLIAAEISLRLVELRPIGARIELGQQFAFIDDLAVLEVDAEDLFGDHAAHRRRVQRRHIADAGQHDREILLFDRGRDDRNRRQGLRLPSAGAVREMLPSEIARCGDRNQHEADKQRRASPVLRGASLGYLG